MCDRLLFFMTEVEGVVDRRILNDVAIIPNSNGTLPCVCFSPKCNVGLMIVVFAGFLVDAFLQVRFTRRIGPDVTQATFLAS